MARYEQIAGDLRDAIVRGDYAIGAQLPSEAELAIRYSAARGTVRQAVALLAAEGLVGSRQGARRIVLGSERSQSFAELHSFAQWARSMGYRASGSVLSARRRPCSPSEAVRLSLEPGEEVLDVLRLRRLDGEPVLVERTVYAGWIAPAVERLDPECESVTQELYESVGLVFAYGEHLIDAVAAGSEDARLLEVRRGSPLLRQRRVTTTQEGRPVECSDDRYRAGSVTFSIRNSTAANPLVRRAGD
ncbi:GntR family transcriptional regulator [Microbispora sp. SCL1-1]|jgi:GntR family transcriptional regulator|uniref:GntR family transcriptional regulator n=1 Tax=Microbispora hainanensis TaxID=568844 RepID=A0ABZ1SRU1_9ACTN|nr:MULTISPECIES: GntR family transcriptional regulator [Microbispora]NJP27690.1 GntR family transcriptional regulator [Microbispora sp. CL1-1]TQS10696.1 GntR family transcriptional regulator [Microbispora sp. SCL1-1]